MFWFGGTVCEMFKLKAKTKSKRSRQAD